MVKRGVVWIAPSFPDVPAGRMVDPATSWFWMSWQDEGVVDQEEVLGAENAIAWACERAADVLIRLGQSDDTYFSAGIGPAYGSLPKWPPAIPSEGWFRPASNAG